MAYGNMNAAGGALPLFTYTGNMYWWDAHTIALTSSGVLVFSKDIIVNAFLVGGGGGGGARYNLSHGGGGGGGYTATHTNVSIDAIQPIQVVIGAGGAGGVDGHYTTSAGTPGGQTQLMELNLSVLGGGAGDYTTTGSGGSGGGTFPFSEGSAWREGGTGGSDGSDGLSCPNHYKSPGTGQHTTTRAFGEADGALFSPGGGGNGTPGAGLQGDNSGAGGNRAQAGCSGIVLIRSSMLKNPSIQEAA